MENQPAAFEYRLVIGQAHGGDGTRPVAYEVKTERLSVLDPSGNEVVLLEHDAGTVRIAHEDAAKKPRRTPPPVAMSAPRDGTVLFRLYDLPETPRLNLFRQYLRSWRYYDFCISALRGAIHQPGIGVLQTHGENLASVLYQLKISNERNYQKLVEPLRFVEPNMAWINFFVSPDNKNVFMFLEDRSGNRLASVQASAGTLRFLAMLCALLPTTADPPPFSPLVIIEEPENGLYVALLKRVLEIAWESPLHPQVFFSSHAPYFIDMFDGRLESVLILHKRQGQTRVEPVNAAKAEARLEDMSLGEQHFQGLLQ